jgi:CheY-like chemotaxis protein
MRAKRALQRPMGGVALTADVRAERREGVFEAGANDFFTKLVAIPEFRASLERLRSACSGCAQL